MDHDYLIFFDAGRAADTGMLAVAGVVCTIGGEVLVEQARDAGAGTSNVGEYRALAHAVCMANLVGARQPMFCSDSLLVVQQVNRFWAMRGDPGSPLQVEHARCTSALMTFDRWLLRHVPRERNRRADWLVSDHLGLARTLKSIPGVTPIQSDGDGLPGWSRLESRDHRRRRAVA